jgi:alkanesulfonate monooxygenase SsuD/methylene tetrahydromethanopterin reductase-like flavin-dependent oxidoreductase (luciferase family)
LTSRIEIITAIKPYLYHPVVLAKMALQIENISRGRFAINVVNGGIARSSPRRGSVSRRTTSDMHTAANGFPW